MFPHASMRSVIVSKSRVFYIGFCGSAWETLQQWTDRFHYTLILLLKGIIGLRYYMLKYAQAFVVFQAKN